LNFGFALIGTSERVCLITGNVGAIMAVLIFIMEKIREKPDMNAKQAIDFDNKTSAERDKQVRFIMFMYILYVDVNFNVFLWAGNFMVLLNLTKNQVHYRSVFIIHVQNV
jgi:fucose permease